MPAKKPPTDEKEFRERLASHVLYLRTGKRWTQVDLARRLGFTTKTRVARVEAGEIPTTLGFLASLADAFDMGLVEFVAAVVGDTSPAAIVAEAHAYASRTLHAKREALVEALSANLDRPSLQWLVRATVLASERMTDDQVAFLGNLLDSWRSRGWSEAVAAAQTGQAAGEDDEA